MCRSPLVGTILYYLLNYLPMRFTTGEIRSRGRLPTRFSALDYAITLATAPPRRILKLKLGENVLNSRRIMRGYHIRIRVTSQSTSTATKTPTTTAKTGAPRAAWTTGTYIPKSIFEILPSHTPKKTSRNNAILGSKRTDYRYGPIRIDWLDLKSSPQLSSSVIKKPKSGTEGDTMDNAPTASAGGSGKEKDLRGRGEPSDLGSRSRGAHISSRRSNRSQICT